MDPKEETKKKDWADMDDEDGDQEELGLDKPEAKKQTFTKGGKTAGGNAPKAKKNAQGDFIITSFNVDTSLPEKKTKEEGSGDESDKGRFDVDSDSGYGEEDDGAEEKKDDVIPEEPKKKGKWLFNNTVAEVKTLSKKEQQALEDAELDALLSGMKTEDKPVESEKKAPVKAEVAQPSENNAKNRKKKEAARKRKEAEEAAKAKDEKKEEPVEAADAAKAALAARMAKKDGGKPAPVDRTALAAQMKASKEAAGKKKDKKFGATSIFT